MPIATEIKKTRIFLVDDHALVREHLSGLLRAEPDLAVCGEAADAATARTAIATEEPDLVVLDISLKHSNGLDLLKEWRVSRPGMRVLVLSMHDEMRYAEQALQAGARGYITKEDATVNLMAAIRHVLAGEIFLSERMAAGLRRRQGGAGAAGRQSSSETQ